MLQYPTYKQDKKEIKPLTVADFPPRISTWLPSSLRYFLQHGIAVSSLLDNPLVYPTHLGICYVMTGPYLCYQVRITEPGHETRFWSPPGAALGQVLFFPHRLTALFSVEELYTMNPSHRLPLVVTEGVTDALAVDQAGHYACSLIGAQVSSEQLTLLRHYSVVYTLTLIPDRDEAGDRQVRALTKELSIRVRYLPAPYKDICEMPVAERGPFLNGAVA